MTKMLSWQFNKKKELLLVTITKLFEQHGHTLETHWQAIIKGENVNVCKIFMVIKVFKATEYKQTTIPVTFGSNWLSDLREMLFNLKVYGWTDGCQTNCDHKSSSRDR
jgi:hypothetical protein